MNFLLRIGQAAGAAVLLLTFACARAGVTSEEAVRLKADLTPLGAERAGNKEGTIPPWTGGYTAVPAGFKNGGRRPDLFASDKPLFSITAQNVAQHADKLTAGSLAMFKRFPATYRIDVYPSRRTHAAPQWVYDNTLRNATQARLVETSSGPTPQGAYGGVPFPLPKTGAEVMWNHALRWRGVAWHWDARNYQVTSDGKHIVLMDGASDNQNPYYFNDVPAEKWSGGFYDFVLVNAGPPIRAGEAILARSDVQDDKTAAWVYLTGQRRVRKLPNPCCDTPTPTSGGLMTFDEVEVFQGRLTRFDWKLLGKKEMYIPYNSNRTLVPTSDEAVLGERHLNPDHVRWELHRVWVVEARLAQGQRHPSVRSLYYIDEDTWMAVLADRWDAHGQLSRTLWQIPYVMPDLPGVATMTFGFYDQIAGSWFAAGIFNSKSEQIKFMPRYANAVFSPDSLASEGIR